MNDQEGLPLLRLVSRRQANRSSNLQYLDFRTEDLASTRVSGPSSTASSITDVITRQWSQFAFNVNWSNIMAQITDVFHMRDASNIAELALQHPALASTALEAGQRLKREIPEAIPALEVNADEDGFVVIGFVPMPIDDLMRKNDEIRHAWSLDVYNSTNGRVLVTLRGRRRDVESH